MIIAPGATSRSITVYAYDATTGLPYSSAAYNDAGIALWYRRGVTGAKTAITPATLSALTDAYSSGGFKAIAENAYRLDVPDAAWASGADMVVIGGSATAWKLIPIEVALETPQTGDSYARIGANGAGLTGVGDTSGTTTLLSRLSATRAGYLDNLSAGAVALAADLATVAGYLDTEVAAILAAVDTEVAAIKAKTDNLPTDPADQSAVEAAITAAQAALAALIAALNDIAAADVWTALDDASANKIADHVLRRSWATAAGSADGDALAFRSLLGAVAKLVNRVGISGATLTVYEDDDLTALGTQAVTSDADAEPITGVNTN